MTSRPMLRAECFVLIAALVVPAVSGAQQARKVAVLISPQRVVDLGGTGVLDHTEYWDDLVLTHDMLKLNGFVDPDIFVLYANGDRLRDYELSTVNVYPASRENIKQLLACLAGDCGYGFDSEASLGLQNVEKLSADDFLFVAWVGHGDNTVTDAEGEVVLGCVPCQDCPTVNCDTYFKTIDTNEPICDCEIPRWMQGTEFKRRAFVFSTCRAGGVVGDLTDEADDTVVLAACKDDQAEYPVYVQAVSGGPLVAHREWLYLVDTALKQLVGPLAGAAADENSNNLVALDETFDWSVGEVTTDMEPVLGNREKAKCVHLRLPEPSEDKEIFSMDHAYDWSMEPSTVFGTPWWEGPDLWVRNSCSCLDETHVEPIYGQPSYLCARVYNIGCDDLSDVEVRFSWVESTGWANPASWHPIASTTVDVASAKSVKTPPVEWTDVPLPGSYCLHAVVEIPEDPWQDPRAEYDNNVTQINLSVLNVVGDLWSWWPFFVENWSTTGAQQVDVTFDLADLADGTELAVEFPAIIDATIPPSMTRSDVGGWTVLGFGPSARPAQTVRINLGAGSRLRAIVRMKLPSDPHEGESNLHTVERADHQQMGGIVFRARVAELEEVACSALRNLASLLGEVAVTHGDPQIAEEFQAIARMDVPCQVAGLCEEFADVQQLYADGLANDLGPVIRTSPIFRARFEAASAGFAAENLEEASEEVLRSMIEHARELSLYAWLILEDTRP